MKQLYSLLLIMFFSMGVKAQVTLNATAATTGPSNYPTLKSAFDAINAGTHQGTISLLITADLVETSTAVLKDSGVGNSSYSSITVTPSGTRSISGLISGALIELDGADNTMFDGLNSGGNSLTLVNTYSLSTASASVIHFINGASSNIFTRLQILGACASTTSGVVFFDGGTSGNNYNEISLSVISAATSGTPANGVYSTGSTTPGAENTGNLISGNKISDFFQPDAATTGILVGAGNTTWTIVNNHLFQTATRTFTAANIHRAIAVSSGAGYNVHNNTIGYNNGNATGVYTLSGGVASRFIGIEIAVGETPVTKVTANAVTEMSFVTTANSSATTITGVWCGIYVVSGNVNVGEPGASNLIGSPTLAGSIVISPTVNNAYAVAIASTTPAAVNIRNNVIGGISLTPSGASAGTLAGISTSGGGTIIVSHNSVGNPTADNMRIGTAGVTTQGGIIRGIINTGTANVQITNNRIRNLSNFGSASTSLFRALESQAGAGRIGSNLIHDLKTGGTIASFSTQVGVGILVNSTSSGVSIDSNTINNLHITSTGTTGAVLSGIFAGNASATTGITNGLAITRNRIYGLTNGNQSTSNTSPSTVAGIFVGNASAGNPMVIANNMVALGSGQSNNNAYVGIWNYYLNAQNFTAKIYHNTVHITGTASSGAQPSFCYLRGDFSTNAASVPTVDIRNNIFTNLRSGGTGRHFAIANGYQNATSSSTGWTTTASNYNLLHVAGENLGYWSGPLTYPNWLTASGGDQQSLNGIMPVYANPAEDLHLVNLVNADVDNLGTPLGDVTMDIDDQNRSVTTPDMGADEFANNVVVPISLVYFTGKAIGHMNQLTWLINCNSKWIKMELQRGVRPNELTTLSMIQADEERCKEAFNFKDEYPLTGINYYRLKTTDADGAVSYSNTIALRAQTEGFDIKLIPGLPGTKTAEFNINTNSPRSLLIRVIDVNGRILKNYSTKTATGSTSIPVDVNSAAAGIYYIVVEVSGVKQYTFKLIN